VPALERLPLREVYWIVDVLVEVDVIPHVALLRANVLPALQQELAFHQAAAEGHQFLVERYWGFVDHPRDGSVAGIRVDRRASQNERGDLVGESRREHGGHPSALAETDQIHTSTQVVDRHDRFGQNAGTLVSNRSVAFTGGAFDMRNPFALLTGQGATTFVESITVGLANVRAPPHRRVMRRVAIVVAR
jgi:hypothetical protein